MIKRWNTSAWYAEQKKIKYDETAINKGSDSCKSITDKSSFVPNAEIMKKARQGIINGQAVYDFQNGKDNGMKVPVSRIKGLDIAELSETIIKQQEDVKDKMSEAQAKAEAQAQAEASLKAYKEATTQQKAES